MKNQIQADMEVQQFEPINPIESWKVERFNRRSGYLPDYNCEKCKNKGCTAHIGQVGFMVVSICSCSKIRKTIKNAKESGAWDLIQEKKFENFTAEEEWQKIILESVKQYSLLEKKPWLFLGGKTGAGKTHLVTAAFASILRDDIQGIYIIWPREESRLNGAGFAGADFVEERINELTSVPALYIDDLFKTNDRDLKATKAGRELPSKQETDLAFEIINIRYNRRLLTLISSEFDLKGISAFNGAIAGRIQEMCAGYNFDLVSDRVKNYRIRK